MDPIEWRGPHSQPTTRQPTNLYKYPHNRTELCLALSTNRCFSVQFTYLTIATTDLLVNVDTCRVHYILQQEVKSPFDGLSNLQPHHTMGSKLTLQVSIELRYQAMRLKLRRQSSQLKCSSYSIGEDDKRLIVAAEICKVILGFNDQLRCCVMCDH